MNGLWFEDFEVGQRFETSGRTVTEADVVAFAGVSGDFNELHTNAEAMRESRFGQRIAHGALVLSLVTGLRGQLGIFEGTAIALLEIRRWRFKAPVYFGDTVRVLNEVADLRETSKSDRGVMTQAVQVLNQRDELVQEGEMVTMMRRKAQ